MSNFSLKEKPIEQLRKIWGNAASVLYLTRKIWWIDLALLLGLGGLIFGMMDVAGEWTGQHRPAVEIDLSPWALPKYTFFSLCRGLMAYILSLGFTLAYGYWAAKDHLAEKVLIPLLDILQSIPVLGFMPGVVLAMVALFPNSNIGLELSSVILIFTGQVWNMTFSFYQSLRSVPQNLLEASTIFHFSPLQKAIQVELPFSAIGLIWNSMMSMAGGWFFLAASEAFVMGDKDFRLPGLGSYMSVAMDKGDWLAMVWGVLAMTLMITFLDQLLWRPLVVWGQKFRVEEGSQEGAMESWFLDFLRRSQILQRLSQFFQPKKDKTLPPTIAKKESPTSSTPRTVQWFSLLPFALLVVLILFGAWRLIELFSQVHLGQWMVLFSKALASMARVLAAAGFSLLWTVPVGLWVGLSAKRSRVLQPIIQVVASFPSSLLFPAAILVLNLTGIPLAIGSIFLMLLGTQWYILFNVVAGAMAIPSDLREAAEMYDIKGWQRFIKFYLPGIFPYLVTGLVTATGNAWNTSIVAEYVTYKGQTLSTWGLGSQITDAANRADFPMLAASVVVMSLVVVTFNRLVWKKLYALAEEKYSLNK